MASAASVPLKQHSKSPFDMQTGAANANQQQESSTKIMAAPLTLRDTFTSNLSASSVQTGRAPRARWHRLVPCVSHMRLVDARCKDALFFIWGVEVFSRVYIKTLHSALGPIHFDTSNIILSTPGTSASAGRTASPQQVDLGFPTAKDVNVRRHSGGELCIRSLAVN